MRAINVCFWIITVLTVVALGFVWIVYRTAAGIALYDSNFEAFHDTLSPQQGAEIIQTSKGQLSLVLLLLTLICLMWFGLGAAAVNRMNRASRTDQT